MKGNPWTKRERDVVRRDWASLSAAEIAERLPGRTRASVLGMARRLGLSDGAPEIREPREDIWTDEDMAYLRAKYGSMTASAIGHHIGRSECAVRGMAHRLGLKWKHRKPEALKVSYRSQVFVKGLRPKHVRGDVGDPQWYESCDRAFRAALEQATRKATSNHKRSIAS